MQRTEHPDNGEDRKRQGDFDCAVARELTERFEPQFT